MEKFRHMKLEVMHAAKDQKRIRTFSTGINHTRSVHMKCYSRDYIARGGEGGLITFLFGKRGLIRERGLMEDLQ